MLAACSAADEPPAAAPYDVAQWQDSIATWQAERNSSTPTAFGWTSLVGRHSLPLGDVSVGSGSDNTVVLLTPNAPTRLGVLHIDSTSVVFEAARGVAAHTKGAPVTSLALGGPDADRTPRVSVGPVSIEVIARADLRLLRVRDSLAPTRTGFKGLEYYPVDSAWRLPARFVAYEPARRIEIVNIIGTVDTATVPGALEFLVDGQTYRLDAVGEGRQFFVNFRDQTSDSTSYPAGRFLQVTRPDSLGRVVIDFNRAYNPPCAFSAYATCPLPPAQNKLALAIPAGERRYHFESSAP